MAKDRESRWVDEFRAARDARDGQRMKKAQEVLAKIRASKRSAPPTPPATASAQPPGEFYDYMPEKAKEDIDYFTAGLKKYGPGGSRPNQELYDMFSNRIKKDKARYSVYQEPSMSDYDLSSGLGAYDALKALDSHPAERRDGDEGSAVMVNKFKALADLAYGSPEEVFRQAVQADRYSKENELGMTMLPDYGDEQVRVYRSDESPHAAAFTLGGNMVPYIQTRGYSSPGRYPYADSRMGFSGQEGPDVGNIGVFGHELSHVLEGKDETAANQYSSFSLRPASEYNVDSKYNSEGDSVYGEFNSSELHPALSALTRYEFSKSGKRITKPEEYDKKVSDYVSKTESERAKFKSKLPPEVSRFYGYLDHLEKAKEDIKVKKPGESSSVETIKKEDRLKRFNDINRRLIPGLVHQDGYRGQMDLAIMA